MEWCLYYNISAIRINEHESINIIDDIVIDDDIDVQFLINGQKVSLRQIDAVWFRRGVIGSYSKVQTEKYSWLHDNIASNKKMVNTSSYYKNESDTFDQFVVNVLKQKRSLSDPYQYNANKLIALSVALSVGLYIPQTLITKSALHVRHYFGKERIITKSIQDHLIVGHKHYAFTPTVLKGHVQDINMPERFYYSKFQKQVKGKYELRIFFVGNQYYASARFNCATDTQETLANSYNERVIPYQLPADVLNKLKAFNLAMNYNTGSIDMMVDEDDKHYFLEINPVGQYDFTSQTCNYNLDEKILKYFTDERSVQ